MSIGAVCNREVTIARAIESLQTTAELMQARRVGSIVVCNEVEESKRTPIGILTDRDIALAVLRYGKGLDELVIGQAMTRNPLVLQEGEEAEGAIERLRERAVRRAPVVDSHGFLIGIISSDDLLELIAEELDAIARLIRRQRPPT